MISARILIFDVTDKEDKKEYFKLIEGMCSQSKQHLISSNHTVVTPQNQIQVVIMGGDGSLGQTLRELRSNAKIDENINKITFCLLPYGTGNDTGQVFGWGSKSNLLVFILC